MFEEEINELKINYEQALKKRDEGDYKGAVEALYKALDIDNKNVDVLVMLAEIFSLLNDYERSVKYYSLALDTTSTSGAHSITRSSSGRSSSRSSFIGRSNSAGSNPRYLS